METGPDNFESLRKLMSLKKHEQPPPGYFNNFSGKVIARIESGGVQPQASWLHGLLTRFDAKPVMVCAYALGVAGLIIFGIQRAAVESGNPATADGAGISLDSIPPTTLALSNQVGGQFIASPAAIPGAPSQTLTSAPPEFLFKPYISVERATYTPAGKQP